jgi:hypothetical protein
MGIWFIRISTVYLLVGTALGMYISITSNFALNSVHTHISLLGWTTMTLVGLIYHNFQNLEKSILCKIDFIIFNIGLPIMMIGLAFLNSGFNNFLIVVSIGATITSIAILIFTVHILTRLKNIL